MPGPHAPCQLSVGRMASNEKLLVALLAKKKRKRRSAERKVHVCASYMYYPEGCTQECIIHFSLICVQTKINFSTIFAWASSHLKNFSATLEKTSQGLQQSWENVFHQTRNWPSLSMIGCGQWAAVADTCGVVWKLPFKIMLYSEWRTLPVSATICGSETPKCQCPGSCPVETLLWPSVKAPIGKHGRQLVS